MEVEIKTEKTDVLYRSVQTNVVCVSAIALRADQFFLMFRTNIRRTALRVDATSMTDVEVPARSEAATSAAR